MSFVGSHLWQIRQVWGSKPLRYPGFDAIVTNAEGHILLGYRPDLDAWSTFGGSLEVDEGLETCIRREIAEELGGDDFTFHPIGIVSDPKHATVTYTHGDVTVAVSLLVEVTLGFTPNNDAEHEKIAWFPLDALPDNLQPISAHEILLYRQYKMDKTFKLS